ncbi:MAG TPA: transaldolase [Acidimicrobiales bacterium]|nr:transaldolase [Acidimicrobiales bacterium]
MNELYEVYGQSAWIDNIRRDWLHDGTLARFVEQGVRGVTSNPSIFAKALATSTAYDDAIRQAGAMAPEELFETLAVSDVREACDVLAAVHGDAQSGFDAGQRRHGDGFVSLEVSPRLAHDTEATIAAALRLWNEVDRANLMIKIPATVEGLPAISEVLSHGVNVNVTLIFSVDRYADVIGAWASGLRDAIASGHDVSRIASVASFFVSRVDVAVDALLADGDPRRGTAANAQAAQAYETYQRLIDSPHVLDLLGRGAQVQRPLWASTSTKNPLYDDLLYVNALVAPETVNTMPDATLDAALDHGRFSESLLVDPAVRREEASRLDALDPDVSLAAVTAQLERDGVAAFVSSYEEVLETVAAAQQRLS